MKVPTLPPRLRRQFRRRLHRHFRRLADVVPPTWRGTLLATVSGLALWFWGFGSLDLVLYVLGITGLVLLLLASLLVGGTALWLRRRLGPAPAGERRLEAGSPIATGFEVPALTFLPLVQVRWEWLEPAAVEVRVRPAGKVLREEAVARHRGQAGAIRRRITVADAFGLTRVAFERVDPVAVTILPAAGGLRSMPVIQSMTAHEGLPHPSGSPEGDRMEIRRYVPGDSVRFILWKTYARTGQLNVRVPELAIERSRKTVAYLLAGPDDEAAAAAARVALEGGALGESWVFGADGTPGTSESLGPALQAIARSGSWRASDHATRPTVNAHGTNGHGANGHDDGDGKSEGSGLAAFLRQAGRQGDSHCIVFAAARPGPWTAAVLDAVRAYPGSLSFVLGTDGIRRDAPPALWRRLLFTAQSAPGTPAEELSRLLRTLGDVGCPALVVDRPSGRAYDQHQQRVLGASR